MAGRAPVRPVPARYVPQGGYGYAPRRYRSGRGVVAGIAAVVAVAVLGKGVTGGATAAPVSPAGAVAEGQQMAAAYGWGSGRQWDCLYATWERESSWETTAVNPASGTTGIPQLNPADFPVPADWSSAAVQIRWGLGYIQGRYGTPCAAWAHEEDDGWY